MKYDNAELLEILERASIETDKRVNADTRGHVWVTKNNHVVVFGGDFHNHIHCQKCGYVYCIACHDVPPKPCTKGV